MTHLSKLPKANFSYFNMMKNKDKLGTVLHSYMYYSPFSFPPYIIHHSL